MQLSPNSRIPVSYCTTIPGDTTLYFVQAVLRDTQSSAILQTLNLTNVSSTPNRYTGVFNPVSDPSGLGRPIDITITVYTDAGHTTPSFNYQILQLNYTILQPWIQNLGMGGGLNIDYDKLQLMFDGSKVTNAEIGNEKPVEVDYDRLNESLLGATEGVRTSLSEEFQGHMKNVSQMIGSVLENSRAMNQNNAIFLEGIITRIVALEDKLDKGQNLSSKERREVKRELVSALSEIKEGHSKSFAEGSKSTEKLLKKTLDEIQSYLGENLSEKEIKINYTPTAPKREKENSKYSNDDIAAFFR